MDLERPDFNLIGIFEERCRRFGRRPALMHKRQGEYRSISWGEWAGFVKTTAAGLSALGVLRGERVAILSENRPEWTYADLGALALGAVVVPIYPTSSPPEVEFILRDAEVRVIFVSNMQCWEKVRPCLVSLPLVRAAVAFGPCEDPDGRLIPWDDFLGKGREILRTDPSFYPALSARIRADDTATVIYTSGTTGHPKGVVLSHGNFVSNCIGASRRVPISEKDTSLSYLPLSHVFERMGGYYFMIFQGTTIAYAENMQTIPEDLRLVRPTVMTSVPRLFEKTYARISDAVAKAPAWRKALYAWAVRTGRAYSACVRNKTKVSWALGAAYAAAGLLVYRKVKAQFGGRIRFFISGGAALPRYLAEFFHAVDILILEGYGLTETSPVIAVNSPDDFRFGTVGKVLPNVEIALEADGEIKVRGPSVMKGYAGNIPATRQAIRGGWFYTGDIGLLDGDGFLSITDRKKDILVTSGGKNIAPQNIENLILSDSVFTQAVVVGDGRHYLVALIVPNRSEVERYAAASGLAGKNWDEILADPKVYAWLESRIMLKTRDLASYEQIKYFHLLPRELSQAEGELTPTLKVKRKVVTAKFAPFIDALYARHVRPESARS